MRKKATNKQKSYINDYNRENYRRFSFPVHREHNKQILEYLESVPNVRKYLLDLIAADMKAKGIEVDQ